MASQQGGANVAQQFRLNETYKSEEFKAQVRACLEGNHADSKPFPHFALANFLQNAETIADLRKELQSAAWVKKCNDLYSMSQTVDLVDFQADLYPKLSAFRQFMAVGVRQWLETATGVQLGEKLALTGSRYASGDCLLPHDDRLEGRAFAFVLYLSAGWSEADGGHLCLFNSDPLKNHPTDVAKRIPPLENTFSLFRVQNNSWHSVSEVLSEDRQRLSLNGWFHYPEQTVVPLGPGPAPEEPLPRAKPTMDITLAEVNAWLNQNYVKPGQHKQIKRIFAYKSELSLQQFLNPERYNAALAELETAEFACIGPPNKRHVWRLVEPKLAEGSVLCSLLRLFRSEAITLLLTQWTGLHLYDLKRDTSAAAGAAAAEERAGKAGQPETTGTLGKGSPSSSSTGVEGGKRKAGEEEEMEGGPPQKRLRLEQEEAMMSPAEGTSSSSRAPPSLGHVERKEVQIVSCVHRYERGCYSMADDQMAADTKNNGFCLDLLLFFGPRPEWPSQQGGFTSFFAIGESDEIMRLNPTMNTAAIVFREPEVLNFTKYVNHRAGDDHFFVLSCSFFGISSGESESESSLESDEAEGEEESPGEEFGDEEEEPVEGEDGQPV